MKLRDLIGPLQSGKDIEKIVEGQFAEDFPVGVVFNIGGLRGDALLLAMKKLMPESADVSVVRPFTDEETVELVADLVDDEEVTVEVAPDIEEIPVAEVEESVDSVTDSNEMIEETKPAESSKARKTGAKSKSKAAKPKTTKPTAKTDGK
jgi:hypothetical protein